MQVQLLSSLLNDCNSGNSDCKRVDAECTNEGRKKGFIRIGDDCYLREDAIVAVWFGTKDPYADPDELEDGDENLEVVVELQGAATKTFKDDREVAQLRDWVTKQGGVVSGMGPKIPN